MPSGSAKDTLNWLIFGLVLPIVAEILGVLVIATTNSGAYAEGFAGIVLLVMLIIGAPLTLFGNALIVSRSPAEKVAYLRKGMILPVLFLGACLVYYTGFWDKFIDPLFPSVEVKLQTGGGGRLDDDTYEFFVVANSYSGSDAELAEFEEYSRQLLRSSGWTVSDLETTTVLHYFVPRDMYDPIHDAPNRDSAVTIFRYTGSNGELVLDVLRR